MANAINSEALRIAAGINKKLGEGTVVAASEVIVRARITTG